MKKLTLTAAAIAAISAMSLTSFAACGNTNSVKVNKKVYYGGTENFKASTLKMLKKYFPKDYQEYYDKLFGYEEAEKEETPKTEAPETEKEEGNDYIAPDISEDENVEEEKEETTEEQQSSSYQAEVTRLVNIERAKEGLPALTVNYTVQQAAQKRAEETKKSFSHTRPNGTSCFTVLGEFGVKYSAAGENIAYGQRTPAEVVNAWMNSAGHRKNIMSSTFTQIGVGCYESNGTIYWSQLFIK